MDWTVFPQSESESLSRIWLFAIPMDCSPPGSSVHGILHTRILEWDVIPFSRGSTWPGIKPESLELQADSLLSEPLGSSQKTCPSPSPQHQWNVILLEYRVFAEVSMTWPSDILDSGCILNPMTGVFIRDTQRGRPCEDESRDCSDVCISWGTPGAPRNLKRKRSIVSWRLFGEHGLTAPQTPWL